MLLLPVSLALLCPLSPDVRRSLELQRLEAGGPNGKKREVRVGIIDLLLLLGIFLSNQPRIQE